MKGHELKDQLDKHEKVTYQLLERDLVGRHVIADAEERYGHSIEQKRQDQIVQRKEFLDQIQVFNQKEILRALQKKETLKANQDFWDQQIRWNEARKI